jgi:hypothetical protein
VFNNGLISSRSRQRNGLVRRAKGLINGGRNKVESGYVEQVMSRHNRKNLMELLLVINLYVNAQIYFDATDTSEISYPFSLVDIYTNVPEEAATSIFKEEATYTTNIDALQLSPKLSIVLYVDLFRFIFHIAACHVVRF